MRVLACLLFLVALAGPAHAGEAAPLAQDEAVEQRMIEITQDLRCLVCQNESLAASHAELAEDLRREVRQLVRQGRSDREIVDYLVARYGNFVRYRPPFEADTLLLWLGPFVLLAAALGGLVWQLRRRAAGVDVPLDAADRAQAERLLQDDPQESRS